MCVWIDVLMVRELLYCLIWIHFTAWRGKKTSCEDKLAHMPFSVHLRVESKSRLRLERHITKSQSNAWVYIWAVQRTWSFPFLFKSQSWWLCKGICLSSSFYKRRRNVLDQFCDRLLLDRLFIFRVNMSVRGWVCPAYWVCWRLQ